LLLSQLCGGELETNLILGVRISWGVE